MRMVLGGVMAVALVAAGASADDKKDTDKVDAKKLVGRWEPKAGDAPMGAKVLVEFTKDGKVTFTASGEKEFKAEGTYKVEGDKLTTRMKFGSDEKTTTRTILKLTDTELVSKDEKGKEDTLVRVKADR